MSAWAREKAIELLRWGDMDVAWKAIDQEELVAALRAAHLRGLMEARSAIVGSIVTNWVVSHEEREARLKELEHYKNGLLALIDSRIKQLQSEEGK